MSEKDREQLERVRERFTRTAQLFASFALAQRSAEAVRLVALVAPRGEERALDLACGPGTFLKAFAPRVKFICGVDLTAAMLQQARRAAAQAALVNVTFAGADGSALPFADSSFDLVACGYTLHHLREPGSVLAEVARVLRRAGRVALADLIVPEGADSEFMNRIEGARDASHTNTLALEPLRRLVAAAGFRLVAVETGERLRDFDDWMRIAGWQPGTPAHRETRRLMETSIPGDIAGFHPRLVQEADAQRLEFVQTTAFLVAEKR